MTRRGRWSRENTYRCSDLAKAGREGGKDEWSIGLHGGLRYVDGVQVRYSPRRDMTRVKVR